MCRSVLGAALVVIAATACSGGRPPAEAPSPAPQTGPTASANAAREPSDEPAIKDAMRRGIAALKDKEFATARDLFQGVLDRRPGSPRPCYFLGVALDGLGQKEEAEKQFRSALAKAPELGDAAAGLSLLLIESGRNDEAATVLRHAIAKAPPDARLHRNLARALSRLGEHEAAADQFRTSLRMDDDVATRLTLGRLLAESGKKAQALVELKQVVLTSGGRRDVLVAAGDTLSSMGAYGECVSAFEKAIAVKADAGAYASRASCRQALGETAGAKEDLDRALKLDDKHAGTWCALALHHAEAGKKGDAAKALQKCKQLDKSDSQLAKRTSERITGAQKAKN